MSGPGKKLNKILNKKLLAYKFVKNFIAIKKWVFIIDNEIMGRLQKWTVYTDTYSSIVR